MIVYEPTLGDIDLEAEEPGYLLGQIEIFGTEFHVEAMRVVEDEDGCQVAWQSETEGEWNENDSRLIDLFEFAQSSFYTVKIPGFDGEYVLVITPYGK